MLSTSHRSSELSFPASLQSTTVFLQPSHEDPGAQRGKDTLVRVTQLEEAQEAHPDTPNCRVGTLSCHVLQLCQVNNTHVINFKEDEPEA